MDLRIQKTKKYLKEALIQLLQEKEIEKITTTEICHKAMTSRNTFYTYYSDKYELLSDCLHDLEMKIQKSYDALQKKNRVMSYKQNFINLLTAIMDVEEEYNQIVFSYESDLASMCYRFMVRNLEQFEESTGNPLTSRYDIKQLNAFFVLGFWGFIHGNKQLKRETVRENALRLAEDLLESSIFKKS